MKLKYLIKKVSLSINVVSKYILHGKKTISFYYQQNKNMI